MGFLRTHGLHAVPWRGPDAVPVRGGTAGPLLWQEVVHDVDGHVSSPYNHFGPRPRPTWRISLRWCGPAVKLRVVGAAVHLH